MKIMAMSQATLNQNVESKVKNTQNSLAFGMEIVPETKFLENLLKSKLIPSLPEANGGNRIECTIKKIIDIVARANDRKLLDKNLEGNLSLLGKKLDATIPNYKNMKAQLRFINNNGELYMALSSEPIATNGLPSITGKRLAECYSPSNFNQTGTTVKELIPLGAGWPRKLPDQTEVIETSLGKLIEKFSKNVIFYASKNQ